MQRLFLFLLKLLGPRYRLSPDVTAYLANAGQIGETDQIPTELIPLAARLWSRGWFNNQFFDSHREWVLPYWATHQLEPTDRGFVGRALLPVLINLTYRDWTTIGNPGRTLEGIVDPRGLITPQPQGAGWSLDAWVRVDGKTYYPSRLDDATVKQSLHESLPLVQTLYEPAGLRVNQEAFTLQKGEDEDWLVAAFTVENPRGDARTATLYLALRPFNPEGTAMINKLSLEKRKDSAVLHVNGELGVVLPLPDAFGSSDEEHGDVGLHLETLNGATEVEDATGLATVVAAYPMELRPHMQRVVTAIMPLAATPDSIPVPTEWTKADALPNLKRDLTAIWRPLLAQGMSIRVPDEAVQNAFDANKLYLLLLHDGNSITPGPFLYHGFWFRDAAFMLHALDQLGYHEQTKQVLASYPRRLRKDGYMLAQDGEWDSNGQALWSIEQHTRLSGDYEILHDHYWDMLNAAHWIDATRQKTKTHGKQAPEYGLLPAGMSAEHLGPNDFYFWDDWWGLAGLRAMRFAAEFFKNTEDAAKLKSAYDAFALDLNTALARAADANHGLWMPAAPGRGADSAMVSNLIAAYPLQLVAPDDPRIVATIEELRRVAFVDRAFFHHVGHAGFGTYLALHIAGSELYQGKAEAWDAARFLLKQASPTWTWAEAIHPLTRHGGHGDGQQGWMSAEFVSFVRNALLYEEGDHLMLTPLLPEEWVFETASVKVEKAATFFGEVEFTLAFGDHNATLVLKGKWREPPAYIEWSLPIEIKNAGGNQGGVEMIDAHRIRIPNNVTRVVATW